MNALEAGVDQSAPLRTGADRFEEWLTISDAVIRCTNAGLPRTSKTVRKWAVRAHSEADETETTARREDTENGFRWMVSSNWLDCRIAEELEFESRKHSERVPTRTNLSEPVPVKESATSLIEPDANPSEPVATSADESIAAPQDFLRDQVSEKDRQIAKLHEQLERKDEQIMTMLERDRETNILIKGLQGTLERTLGLDKPKDEWEGDSSPNG